MKFDKLLQTLDFDVQLNNDYHKWFRRTQWNCYSTAIVGLISYRAPNMRWYL